MSYAVIAHYRCAEEDVRVVRKALLTMREYSRQEPGNLAYVVHADADPGTAFTLYEQYVDADAFQAHTETEHFTEQIAGIVRPRLIERTVWFGEVL